MPKKGAKDSVKKVPVKADTAALEEQTLAKVERTLRTLTDFLSRWDSAETKPDSMYPEVVKMRRFRDMLLSWKMEADKARGRNDEKGRIRRLRDFVVLCKIYS